MRMPMLSFAKNGSYFIQSDSYTHFCQKKKGNYLFKVTLYVLFEIVQFDIKEEIKLEKGGGRREAKVKLGGERFAS